MSASPRALGPSDPAAVGPFAVAGCLRSGPEGAVYAARGVDGRPVTVVVLGPGPCGDAAARDRFAAAVAEAARRPGVLVHDASTDRHPWAALTIPEPALAALDAVLPAAAVQRPARGPAYRPHWPSGGWGEVPAALPAAMDAGGVGEPATSGSRAVWWVLGAVAAVAAILLAGFFALGSVLSLRDPGAEAAPAPLGTLQPAPTTAPAPEPAPAPAPMLPGPTGPSPASPGPSPAPPGASPGAPSGGPSAAPPPDQPLKTAGPGVAGPSFTPGDATREMRLAGLPFAFRVPNSWGCMSSDSGDATAVRWVCIDERWVLEGRAEPPPSAVIEVRPCPAGCGERAWAALRRQYAAQAPWRPVDAGTAIAEDTPPESPGSYRLRMSRVFPTRAGGAVDGHVYVRALGPPDQAEALQKIVNDIRANTG